MITYKICLNDMYKQTKQPKKHQQKFKRWLLDKKETDQERRERIKLEDEHIKTIDNQVKR
tara:strand:+ start:113 stop:292 length:180 start_codon:yes stop_codon:yes gene_type:complete